MSVFNHAGLAANWRSEERRVGKECRSRRDWSSDVCSSDLDDSRLHLRVLGEIVVQAVGEGGHERLQPRRTGGELAPQRGGGDEQLHAQVLGDLALALGLRQTPTGVEVVCFDALEIGTAS